MQALFKKLDLGLSTNEMKRVIAEFDVNQDGVIEYAEFVPLAVDLIQGIYARLDAADAAAAEGEEAEAARKRIQDQLLADVSVHGASKDQLQHIMLDIFKKADADGSGELSMQAMMAPPQPAGPPLPPTQTRP